MPTAPDVAHSQELQPGVVNPPRRVKRLRELALKDTSSSVTTTNPSVASSPPRASTPPSATPRRRGRKPAGPLSKSAREQLRKTNHSVIEKRRREKINEALAALRELVPSDKPDGEGKEDKEFKLEVLVRTVEYLRIMVAKVKNLERALCQKCGGNLLAAPASAKASPEDNQSPRSVKRKRVECEVEGSGEHLDALPLIPEPVQRRVPSNPPAKPQPPPRLPSISSWMMDSSVGESPVHSHTYQLPSPPHTAPFAPITIASTGFPPRLVLPSPIGRDSLSSMHCRGSMHQGSPLPERALPERTSPSFVSFNSRRDRDVPELPLDGLSRSPCEHPLESSRHIVSPSPSFFTSKPLATSQVVTPSDTSGDRDSGSPDSPWSRDDQTAASLLLNISSRHSSSSSDEETSQNRNLKGMIDRTSTRRGVVLSAQTPSSVLGMAEGLGGENSTP